MLPPAHLMERVSGNADPVAWEQIGKQAADVFMCAVAAWCPGTRDVLDWGCGPGRVSGYLMDAYPDIDVRGCDIDAEAVSWARGHIGRYFSSCGLYPPLPYPAGSFDAVLAVSVMTHLQRRVQRLWLKELARVLRPGGILAATVHGRPAAASFGYPELTGIQDHFADLALDGIAPSGYYRGVIQAEEYTRDAWSAWFEVMDYREAAIGLQDLVICQRRGD